MRLIFIFVYLLSFTAHASQTYCPEWIEPVWQRFKQIWQTGNNDLYLTGYAWHNRHSYSREKINKYNESAWGGGWGKSLIDKKENWQTLYSFAFLDSHRNIQPIAGYAYFKTAKVKTIKFGLGYSIFLTARADIINNIPFPGFLPILFANYRQLTAFATYIPGNHNNGNVLFLFGRWSFNSIG